MFRIPLTPLLCTFTAAALLPIAPLSASAQSNNNIRIMPLGDSITAGYQSTTGNGYRGPLLASLSSQYLYVDAVGSLQDGHITDPNSEGHSGYRIDQVASLTNASLSTYKPNVVTLLLGINDLDQNYEVSTAPDRLASLIDQVLSNEPDATVLVGTLLPRNDSTDEARRLTFNAALPGIVNTRAGAGKHVYLVDMGAITPADEADGLHPNDAGYQIMANAWDAGIQTVIGKGWVKDPVSGSATRPSGSIYSGVAGKCLDNYGAKDVAGAKADVYDCNGSIAGQQWNINKGIVRIDNQCLDIAGGGTANKTLVDLWTCNGAANQVWNVVGNTLVNPASGRCLDDPGASTTNGTQLEIYDCDGGANQQWFSPAYGAITSGISGKCLDDFGGFGSNNDKADSYSCNNAASQQWAVYNHVVKFDGRCLNAVGGGTANGTLVDIETCTGASNQTWTPVNGTLVNAKSGRCLDTPGSSTTNGTQVQLFDCDGGSNQKWTIPTL